MNPERTIQITHKNADGIAEQIDVKMLYCAASETGYQDLSGKTMDIFIPKFDIQDGKAVMTAPPAATDADYIKLATACIVAAYQRDGKEPPITTEDILYNASRTEVIEMIKAVVEMQKDWLIVPSTIETEMKENTDTKKQKNVDAPTKRSKRS